MHSLEVIKKMNGQNPNQEYQTGKLIFDEIAGCLVYIPSRVNNSGKEKKTARNESVIKQ